MFLPSIAVAVVVFSPPKDINSNNNNNVEVRIVQLDTRLDTPIECNL